MVFREYRGKDFIPACVNMIAESQNPEFRTCEVLTRIDNLMRGDEQRLLEGKEKMKMLKSLRKGLEIELREYYLINRKQHNSTKNVFILIDKKIDEYSVLQDNTAPFPKIYDAAGRRV
ncbi:MULTISPECIES: hypothetical protein [unclassified Oceanispirochaeta]|uniref:hypothetical protein n=1 Tax=unclassified Oceanispirochaeta TaxID=2635722 RepID=UPI000E093526|nr:MULTISPECIES: hypothetical protein [unclassified Oceanispirochaeta]MBF9017175.1 hypothetical protein [Oceanispirochaeta sp. M2]NPD73624.1 hypothetical protein [Oceanispirochaeta sp. M1]RDG30727.1 hypothetical protein DV872_16135 [Oceanispirochaeta sp. M1]